MVSKRSVPLEEVTLRRGRGFVVAEGVATASFCIPGVTGDEALVGFGKGAASLLGVDPHFVVVLSERWPGCDVVHYVPVANDVDGLGYGRTNGEERFDDDPDTRLLGVVFLNDVPYWIEHPEEYRSTFLHELGHRWGARVHALRDGVEYPLTGRQSSHWSYFFESFDSPLEGNRFRRSGEGWLAEATHHSLLFSPLDLYLMGVRSADEVPPFRFFPDGQAEGEDCRGGVVSVESGPQWCEPKVVSGQPVELSVDDIVRSEGVRGPSSRGEEFEVLFVVVGENGGLGSEVCAFVERSIPEHLEDFSRATEEGLGLRLPEDPEDERRSCEELAPQLSSGGCQIAASEPSAPFGLGVLGLVGIRRRRR